MIRRNVVELRQSLAEILNRAEYQGERIVIHRRGKDAAAIISIGDLKLLERLIEDAEDRLDLNAARGALAESSERIPYAVVREKLGLDEVLALETLRDRLNALIETDEPRDEWERMIKNVGTHCGVSLPHSALSSEGLYD